MKLVSIFFKASAVYLRFLSKIRINERKFVQASAKKDFFLCNERSKTWRKQNYETCFNIFQSDDAKMRRLRRREL